MNITVSVDINDSKSIRELIDMLMPYAHYEEEQNSDCVDGRAVSLPKLLRKIEYSIINMSLKSSGGSRVTTSRALNIPERTLYRLLSDYGVNSPEGPGTIS